MREGASVTAGTRPSTAPEWARGFRQRAEEGLALRLRVVHPVVHTSESDVEGAQASTDDDWGADWPAAQSAASGVLAQSSESAADVPHFNAWRLLEDVMGE